MTYIPKEPIHEKGDPAAPVMEHGDRFRVTRDWLWVTAGNPRQDMRIPAGTLGTVFRVEGQRGCYVMLDGLKNPRTLPLGMFFMDLHHLGKSHYDDSMELISRSLEYAGRTQQGSEGHGSEAEVQRPMGQRQVLGGPGAVAGKRPGEVLEKERKAHA